jgi:putative holliday junction resolvase
MVEPPAVTIRLLAFDFGLKTIGVAVGQSVTRSATPLPPLSARHGRPDWDAITRLIVTWNVNQLVVGLPLNMDDTENNITVRARLFARDLERRTGLPVALIDERLTSRAAMEYTEGDRTASHGVAAALIAETYLR